MKQVTMFMMSTCPHCQRALRWMDECRAEHPEYRNVDIRMIDETKEPEIAKQYDYYYVPTYYVGDQKVHEGAASREIIDSVFEQACN